MLATVVDQDGLYFATSGSGGGGIGRTNLDGLSPETLATAAGSWHATPGLVVDETNVYWLENDSGAQGQLMTTTKQ